MKVPVNQGERNVSLIGKSNFPDNTLGLLERDSQVFYHQALSSPVFNVISKAEGAYIYDVEGRKYLDLHGNGVHTIGYNNPSILSAIEKQLQTSLTFAPRRFTNLPAIELAEKLVALSPPGLNRVLFCPGGSEAIEMAVMLAKLTTGKWKTLSYYGSFHGAGFQSVSIGADTHFCEGLGPMMPGALHLELPDYYRNPWGWTNQQQIDDEYIRQLKKQIEFNPEIAALIAEPIFYNSMVPSFYYWQQVKDICTQHNILLIFDEIYTAFGRTGKMFAAEHFITPDILVVGKGFGGGIVPFAGIIGREDLNILENKSIGHYTHEKNPFCCTIAKAVIDFIEEHNIVSNANELGIYFKIELEKLQEEFELIGQISGLGLNLALDLVKNRDTKERAIEEAHKIMAFCMSKGISLKLIQGNILNLKPALIIHKNEIDFVISVLKEAFIEIQKQQ